MLEILEYIGIPLAIVIAALLAMQGIPVRGNPEVEVPVNPSIVIMTSNPPQALVVELARI